MMKFKLIGAAALSLALATPAMAMHPRYHHNDGQVFYSQSPVRDALDGDRSIYGAYNFAPRDGVSADYDGRSAPEGYDPVPPSANGG